MSHGQARQASGPGAATDAQAPRATGDDRRLVVRAAAMAWQPSPHEGVWRKRLHHVGPAEQGQVTSVVRFDPGARFAPHDHPEGEEILVLEGVFSDHTGDWPAGSYLLNPEGFQHEPFSREGCTLFVKLRQYVGREQIALDTAAQPWQETALGQVEAKTLHADPSLDYATRLERWRAGARPGARRYPGGVEIFVLEGRFHDEHGPYEPGTWLRLPPGDEHLPASEDGCLLYVRHGAVAELPDRDGS